MKTQLQTQLQWLRLVAPLLLVACSETATAPPARMAPRGIPNAVLDPEVITVTRTTDAGRKHRVKVTTIGHSTVEVPHARIPAVPTRTADDSAAGLSPLPPLTAPSSKHGRRGHWTVTRPYGNEPNAVMELSGENDEPAAVTRLIRDGVVVATVKRKFRPGPTPASWLLVRQETDAPGFRDVIDVNRSGNGESAMPLLGLLAPTKRAPLYGDLDEPIACAPPDMSTPEDKCADYKEAWNWAAAAFLLATAEMDVACINPLVATPLGAFACAALTAHWMIALRDLNIAKDRYDACVAFYRANPPTQRFQPGPSVPCDPDPVFVPDVVGAPPSGNAGAGTSRPGPSTCAVYFEYDLATGEIYFYQILYCY